MECVQAHTPILPNPSYLTSYLSSYPYLIIPSYHILSIRCRLFVFVPLHKTSPSHSDFRDNTLRPLQWSLKNLWLKANE